MIHLDAKTTAEQERVCVCGRKVWFGYQHDGGSPMTKHELPACESFVKLDTEPFRQLVTSKGRAA